MPAKNVHHDRVVRALITDGWTITDDPLTLRYGERELYVDLGAEQASLGAEKGGRKIAVEVQSFLHPSPVHDLQAALGQYGLYRAVLAKSEPDRTIYLALPRRAHAGILSEPLGKLIIDHYQLRLLIFDETQEGVIRWIEPNNTEQS